MYHIDFNAPCRAHFIGIGGISMSGLAEILLERGFTVSGSDSKGSPLTEKLASQGATIYIGQRAENITPDIDIIIYSAAIHPDNPEFAAAKETGKPMLSRASLLGQLMKNYRHAIAVAGTHGKTTTTSMISHILLEANADPTISVGGILPVIGGNIRVGHSDTFLTEACEYTNSFLEFAPTIGIILNIDADHLDFFKDLDDIAASFKRFARLIPDDGALIISKDTAKFDTVTEGLTCPVITYSAEKDADYTAKDLVFDDKGRGSFTCVFKGEELFTIKLGVPGKHNVSNALSAVAAARFAGICDEAIINGLAAFTGTKRRFESMGTWNGVELIDDYAHHPTEINATLDTAKKRVKGDLWVIFQSHTYSRTKALLNEFAEALSVADHVLLPDIYPARETDDLGISSGDIASLLEEKGCDARYIPKFEDIVNYIPGHLKEGDMLITMGAGNVNEICDMLKNR